MTAGFLPWERRWDAWILVAWALCLRVGVAAFCWDRVPPSADGKFYHVVAQRIALGEGYTWLWGDGAVTYAAHYPVGYPALMSVPYVIFGPIPGVVMMLNALLGAFLIWFVHGLCLDALEGRVPEPVLRAASGLVGMGLAVSPTLVGYTPAVMTEGAVATFLACAAWLVMRARGSSVASRRWFLRAGAVAALGGAVLLRPQSVLFAPLLGFLSTPGRVTHRVLMAAVFTLGCVSVVLPWTLRNCDKMERCVFVSANGGWNLLIGTFPEGQGAWVAVDGERVPLECREVFQEAAKDECFGAAGTKRIRENPGRWLSLLPAKLRATLDHTAAAADHLVESGALSAEQKWWLAYPEFAFQRIEFLFALIGAWSLGRRSEVQQGQLLRRLLLVGGTLGFLGLGATWGWLACILLFGWALWSLDVVGVGVGVFAAAVTMLIHGVFFGAGRYALPLISLGAPLSAIGVAEMLRFFSYMRFFGYKSRPRPTSAKFDTRRHPE